MTGVFGVLLGVVGMAHSVVHVVVDAYVVTVELLLRTLLFAALLAGWVDVEQAAARSGSVVSTTSTAVTREGRQDTPPF
ncbi:MAG TPA: hypothetical protein VHD39_05200 [Acidimicrobiales bacterium]|nr:hypothetical protein [Acidimicrobiales bacterium]